MRAYIQVITFAIISNLFLSTHLYSDDDSAAQHLLGDWGGAQSWLEKNGITSESIITFDMVNNVSGGIKRDRAWLGNYDLSFLVDTEKASLWSGGTWFVYFLGNAGDDPTEIVGDLQASNNIESPNTFKLYEFWYEHAFSPTGSSVLLGLHDYNSEFDSLEYASSLINSSFGIQIDISQAGPSIFPTTALATRLKLVSSENNYLLAAVYDGVPGDPNNDHGTHIKLDRSDGYFTALEIGTQSEGTDRAPYQKYALGGWYHSTDFEDFNAGERSYNQGFYLIAERSLWQEAEYEQGLGVFLQSGWAKADRNQIGSYFGAGLSYTGLFDGYDEDVLSFGVAHARNSNEFKDLNTENTNSETAIELTYRAVIKPWLSIQPDLQFIINPGTSSDIDNAVLLGIRTEVAM